MSDNQQQYEDRKLALGNTKSMAELIRDNSRLSSSLAMMTAFVNELLDPEMYGHAVSMEVRDDARELLGMPRVETGESKRCGERRDALATMTAEVEKLREALTQRNELLTKVMDKFRDEIAATKEAGMTNENFMLRRIWSDLIISAEPITDEEKEAAYQMMMEAGVLDDISARNTLNDACGTEDESVCGTAKVDNRYE